MLLALLIETTPASASSSVTRMSYADVLAQLRSAYDGSAADRDALPKSVWKIAERRAFLERLRAGRMKRLLEVGAGTGQDSVFFQEHGLVCKMAT
jgi:hypothetical protein